MRTSLMQSPPRQHFGGELSSIVSSIDKAQEKSLLQDIAGLKLSESRKKAPNQSFKTQYASQKAK